MTGFFIPLRKKQRIMETVENLISQLAESLQGRNALIQVQVGDTYFIRKIGDVNKLLEKPKLTVLSADSSFTEWMDGQIGQLSLRSGTVANHRNCLKHLTGYQPDIRFSDIDYPFVLGFERFLRAGRYSVNTIAKIMKIFKRYVNLAMDEEIFITTAFRKYHIRTEKKERPTLTERELKRLEEVETNNSEEEDTKRAFLLATYTGLRYSDVSRTHKSDIKTINRKKWLVIRQRKTDSVVKIPISTIFKGKAVELIGSHVPPNARCNIVIKRLCKRARVRKKITMHSARRTCASILSARGVGLHVVQHILGHESSKTTEGYISTLDTTISKAVGQAFK